MAEDVSYKNFSQPQITTTTTTNSSEKQLNSNSFLKNEKSNDDDDEDLYQQNEKSTNMKMSSQSIKNIDNNNNHNHKIVGSLPRSYDELAKSLRDIKIINKHKQDDLFNDEINFKNNQHKINWNHYAIMSFFFTILVLSMVWLLLHDSRKCTIDQATVDTCIKRLVFFSSERFPSTEKQLDVYCKEKIKSLQCLRHFVEGCLEVDTRQRKYFKKIFLSYKRQLDKTCLRRAERQKFIDYSNCLFRSELWRNATRCNEAFQNQLIYIAQNVNKKEKIPAACCVFDLRIQCLDKALIKTDCPQSEIKQFVMDQVEAPVRSSVQSLCKPLVTKSQEILEDDTKEATDLELADAKQQELSCKNLFEPELRSKIFTNPFNLIKPADGTNFQYLNDTKNDSIVSLDKNNNGTQQLGSTNDLKFKMVELKFYENFLSFFLIISSD